jgi:hypothetical protein
MHAGLEARSRFFFVFRPVPEFNGGTGPTTALFLYLPEPGCFFPVLHPEEECTMAGLGIGKNDMVTVKPDGNGGEADDMDIEDLEPGLDINKFLEISLDIIPGLLERGIPENDLVIH